MSKFKVGDIIQHHITGGTAKIKELRGLRSEFAYVEWMSDRDYFDVVVALEHFDLLESPVTKFKVGDHGTTDKQLFTLGDTVEFGGMIGNVVKDHSSTGKYCNLEVHFKYEDSNYVEQIRTMFFTNDGRTFQFETTPLLNLISRAKRYKDVKVTVYALINTTNGDIEAMSQHADKLQNNFKESIEKRQMELVAFEKTIQIEVQDE